MTTFICFIIAMVIIYFLRLLTGGFDFNELLSFLIMMGLLGSHVYLSTRKRAIWGMVIPLVILASFYLIYRWMKPEGSTLVILIMLYAIAFGCTLYIWYKARKNHNI